MTQTDNTHTNRPPARPMERPREGRVIAGVALAVAERLGLSPGGVRLVWFISAFFGGLGILLYLAGWVLIPEEDEDRSIAEDVTSRVGDLTTWIGVALIAIATITIVSTIGWVSSDLAWAVVLLAVGVLLYRGHLGSWTGGPDRSSDEGEPAPDDDQAPDTDVLADEVPTGFEADGTSTRDALDESSEPEARRPRRERSILGRLTVGTIFVVIGGMLVLDTTGAIHPDFGHYAAMALAIVGGGLLLGSVYGRSRGLIFLGMLILPVALAGTVVSAEFDGGWGDPVYRPGSIDAVDASYNLTGGELEIDLRRVDLGGTTVAIEGDVGFGRLLVLVPEGAGIDLDAHVGFGDVIVFGDHQGGVDVDRDHETQGDGTFELDLDVGFGAIEVKEVTR